MSYKLQWFDYDSAPGHEVDASCYGSSSDKKLCSRRQAARCFVYVSS